MLSLWLNAYKVALRLREAISNKLPRTVWKPGWNHVVLNYLLLAMFLESLPAAPQPLMAPWAHTAVLTLAKSQPPPACLKLRRFSTTVEQMILAHITSNKKTSRWVSWMLCFVHRSRSYINSEWNSFISNCAFTGLRKSRKTCNNPMKAFDNTLRNNVNVFRFTT